MLVLGIETSCDESAASLLEISSSGKFQVLSEAVSSQIDLHAAYGGVVPELAAREHMRNVPLVLRQVLTQAHKDVSEIELIAVTSGPGLKGCLLVGVDFARGLSLRLGCPLLGVNHLEGHLWAWKIPSALGEAGSMELAAENFLCLLVSGGHTELVQVAGLGKYQVCARTVDDAAGEAFDKSAALLEIAYPGGAQLAAMADALPLESSRSTELRRLLPRVMRDTEGFSFSGLKTAVGLLIDRHRQQYSVSELAWAIQSAIVDSLVLKLEREIERSGIRRVVVSGGVAANRSLRAAISKVPGVSLSAAHPRHCTDNASMIALVGAARYQMWGGSDLAGVRARWPLEHMFSGSCRKE